MRLIGTIEEESQAYRFYSFLTKMGIDGSYDSFFDNNLKKKLWHIWVYDEEKVGEAVRWMEKFKANPDDPEFAPPAMPTPPPPPPIEVIQAESQKEIPSFHVKVHIQKRRVLHHPLTNFFIILCAFVFLFNLSQEKKILESKGQIGMQLLLTPIQKELLFDFPEALSSTEELLSPFLSPSIKEEKELPQEAKEIIKMSEKGKMWTGVFPVLIHSPIDGWNVLENIPMFEKIRQGEIWRIFSPAILHRDFLHILFNMAWLWILGCQIEPRVGKIRYLLLILILGIVSNVAQYLISGPLFLGFSGIVVGMVGFIWVRQKKAPWEGYPLNKSTLVFVLLFVIAMVVLEAVALLLQVSGVTDLTPNIANGAHIVGGLTGMLLGRIPVFSREEKR